MCGLTVLLITYKAPGQILADESQTLGAFVLFFAMLFYFPFDYSGWKTLIHIKNLPNINWNDAAHLLKTQNAALFDARSLTRYESGHAPTARSLPANEFDTHFPKYQHIPKDQIILVYCEKLDCSASKRVAVKLITRGYSHVYNISSGWEEWKARSSKDM